MQIYQLDLNRQSPSDASGYVFFLSLFLFFPAGKQAISFCGLLALITFIQKVL